MTATLKRTVLAVVVLVAAIAGWQIVQGAKHVGAAKPGVTDIGVNLHGFSPRAVQVKAGTTVTWHFNDTVEHDVVGAGLQSPRMAKGTFSFTFDRPGTYDYHCSMHPLMRGRVVVT